MSETVLELSDIVKTFPAVRALDGVHFELKAGEVHALVGENGAGKSTLMGILGGVHRPDSGTIELDGQPVTFANPFQASQRGISVVFQELSLVQGLSVAENIFANRQPLAFFDFIDKKMMHDRARELLKLFALDIRSDLPVKFLSVAQQQVVEILKAMSRDPRVLILDEPTSSLTAIETEFLFQNIRRLQANGTAFIYISHHLREIFEIADRVTVLRDGKYIDTSEIKDVTEESLVKRMVGRELKNVYGNPQVLMGEEYFRVESVSRGKAFHDISFNLRRGEILGFAGLVGAGRTELACGMFGAEPFDSGAMLLDGKAVRTRSPAEAIASGIAYLTEDRKLQGLFLGMPIRENCIAAHLTHFTDGLGFIKESAVTKFAEDNRAAFNIVAPSVQQRVGNLSGGNQQKVLLSMWLGIPPKVLIVDEPTRGVDIGAKAEIYRLLRQLASSGVGIIMISSELEEILGMSDRVLVLREGRLAGEFARGEATEERIIAAATGVGVHGATG
ncbi:MAG TPA: sugar ABC transporter ATP-binding protein [Planctomycetota bacterium]